MKRKILGQPHSLFGEDNRGFIMIISMVIIAAVISIIIIRIALGTLTQLEATNTSLSGQMAQRYTEGCLQEALIQLNRNNAYSGGSLNLGSGACDVSISGAGNTRAISVTGNLNNYYHTLNVNVTLIPFTVITWDN